MNRDETARLKHRRESFQIRNAGVPPRFFGGSSMKLAVSPLSYCSVAAFY